MPVKINRPMIVIPFPTFLEIAFPIARPSARIIFVENVTVPCPENPLNPKISPKTINGESSLGLFKASISRVSSNVVLVIKYSTLIESSGSVWSENKGALKAATDKNNSDDNSLRNISLSLFRKN